MTKHYIVYVWNRIKVGVILYYGQYMEDLIPYQKKEGGIDWTRKNGGPPAVGLNQHREKKDELARARDSCRSIALLLEVVF